MVVDNAAIHYSAAFLSCLVRHAMREETKLASPPVVTCSLPSTSLIPSPFLLYPVQHPSRPVCCAEAIFRAPWLLPEAFVLRHCFASPWQWVGIFSLWISLFCTGSYSSPHIYFLFSVINFAVSAAPLSRETKTRGDDYVGRLSLNISEALILHHSFSFFVHSCPHIIALVISCYISLGEDAERKKHCCSCGVK